MRYQSPRNLWEAVACLADLQHEQARAARKRDWQTLDGLARRRTRAWAYVRRCAEHLAERGEAPADLPDRLRQSLRISADQDQWVQAWRARAEVGERRSVRPQHNRLAA